MVFPAPLSPENSARTPRVALASSEGPRPFQIVSRRLQRAINADYAMPEPTAMITNTTRTWSRRYRADRCEFTQPDYGDDGDHRAGHTAEPAVVLPVGVRVEGMGRSV